MLQLEDRLWANVKPSGRISILLAHLGDYFLNCWLLCRQQFEGKVLMFVLVVLFEEWLFSGVSCSASSGFVVLVLKVLENVDCSFWFPVLFVIGRNQSWW